jgi:hypothetical protein
VGGQTLALHVHLLRRLSIIALAFFTIIRSLSPTREHSTTSTKSLTRPSAAPDRIKGKLSENSSTSAAFASRFGEDTTSCRIHSIGEVVDILIFIANYI